MHRLMNSQKVTSDENTRGNRVDYLSKTYTIFLQDMPKINKSSVKKFKSYPTLKIFKYINSDVFHIEIYVGTKLILLKTKE